MMHRKGQAALEFLTTYGWAFLVILVMIGALAYFGVLNPQKILPNKCIFQTGVDCGRYIIEETDNMIMVELTNNLPEHAWIHPNGIEYYSPISGTYIACDGTVANGNAIETGAGITDLTQPAPFDGFRWNRGQLITVYCSAAEIAVVAGDKAKVDLRIHYNPGAQYDNRFDTYMNGDLLVQAK